MKPSKKRARLADKIKAWEKAVQSMNEKERAGFHKPGSVNK